MAVTQRRRRDEDVVLLDDDGMVLIDGELRTPEWVAARAAEKMAGGQMPERRYFRCYPKGTHDCTTPTLAEFLALTEAHRRSWTFVKGKSHGKAA